MSPEETGLPCSLNFFLTLKTVFTEINQRKKCFIYFDINILKILVQRNYIKAKWQKLKY